MAVLLIAGCYAPSPPEGAPCGPNDTCPDQLTCDQATNTCVSTAGPAPDAGVDSPATTFAALDHAQWLLPCTSPIIAMFCTCDDTSTSVTLDGTAGQTYDVTVRIRAVMEHGNYSGGTAMGNWYVGGNQMAAQLTTASLEISSPPQTYFINAAASGMLPTFDYTVHLDIDGGATATLFASGGDRMCIADQTSGVIDGVTTSPSPYLGQFGQIDVIAVTPR